MAYWTVFVLAFLVIGEWETRARWRPLTVPETRRWSSHGFLSLAAIALGWIAFRASGITTAALVAGNPNGLFAIWRVPEAVAWILTVVLLDLVRYALHVAHHRVPLLWRFHSVHHSDPDVDFSTGLRAHPLDALLIQGVYLIAVALLTPPLGAVVVAECLFSVQAFLAHANARVPPSFEAPLRRFFVTPDMHRLHHSEQEVEQNGNFGDLLSCWDRLFGTYVPVPSGGSLHVVPGLRGLQTATSLDLRFMLALPFQRTLASSTPLVNDDDGREKG